MGLFNRKKQQPIVVTPPVSSRVEIELHKNATKEAKAQADEANSHLQDLLVNNGFTLKIYLAAGGRVHQKKRGGV